jgi:hypothetical protein
MARLTILTLRSVRVDLARRSHDAGTLVVLLDPRIGRSVPDLKARAR